MSGIDLRPATSDDYQFAYRVHCAAMRPSVEETYGWDETWQEQYFREHFDPAQRQIIHHNEVDVGVFSVEEREELLWREAYASIFPDSPFFATVYPAIGFAVWHFAPQSVVPSRAPGGAVSLVVVAGLVGAMWAWIANQTGSILWVMVSHVLFDFSGLGARIYFR